MRPPIDPFSHYVVLESGCWNWSGGVDIYGYGHYTGNKKAHRMFYEKFRGAIPRGMFVCHACDNRRCVNPDHLFLGTPADNSRDMVNKGRHAYGSRTRKSRLNERAVREILQSDEPCFVLAKRFGVRDTTISYVRLGKTWKHVPRPDGYAYTPYRAPGDHQRYVDRVAAQAGVFIPIERAA